MLKGKNVFKVLNLKDDYLFISKVGEYLCMRFKVDFQCHQRKEKKPIKYVFQP